MRRREMGRRDERTHATEFASAVAALGCGGELFNVVVAEDTAGRLDDAAAVGGGVVRLAFAESNTLGHWELGGTELSGLFGAEYPRRTRGDL